MRLVRVNNLMPARFAKRRTPVLNDEASKAVTEKYVEMRPRCDDNDLGCGQQFLRFGRYWTSRLVTLHRGLNQRLCKQRWCCVVCVHERFTQILARGWFAPGCVSRVASQISAQQTRGRGSQGPSIQWVLCSSAYLSIFPTLNSAPCLLSPGWRSQREHWRHLLRLVGVLVTSSFLLLVVMPGASSSFLLLVAMSFVTICIYLLLVASCYWLLWASSPLLV